MDHQQEPTPGLSGQGVRASLDSPTLELGPGKASSRLSAPAAYSFGIPGDIPQQVHNDLGLPHFGLG